MFTSCALHILKLLWWKGDRRKEQKKEPNPKKEKKWRITGVTGFTVLRQQEIRAPVDLSAISSRSIGGWCSQKTNMNQVILWERRSAKRHHSDNFTCISQNCEGKGACDIFGRQAACKAVEPEWTTHSSLHVKHAWDTSRKRCFDRYKRLTPLSFHWSMKQREAGYTCSNFSWVFI